MSGVSIAMHAEETALLESLMRTADTYVEFGAGGSTVLAADLIGRNVITVDSSPAWLAKIAADCESRGSRLTPVPIAVDIGRLADWGMPATDERRPDWPDYSSAPWDMPHAIGADLYLIDGRFRVACCLQTLLHAGAHSRIAIHDFSSRAHYHAVHDFTVEIARARDLSVFLPRGDLDIGRLADHLERFLYDPR